MKAAIRYEVILECATVEDRLALQVALMDKDVKLNRMTSTLEEFEQTNNILTDSILKASSIDITFSSIKDMLDVASLVGSDIFRQITTLQQTFEGVGNE